MSDGPHVSLRDFVQSIVDERDKRYEQRFQEQQRALNLATAERHWNTGTIVAVLLSLLSLVVTLLVAFWRK